MNTPCLVCNGRGVIEVTGVMVEAGVSRPLDPVELTCVWCNGSKVMTPAQVAEHRWYVEAWCRCGNPSGNTRFYENGEDPTFYTHHWNCEDCGKLVQVG